MVDAYLWGVVNRISPEAPVPVFEVKKRENRLGGAANVALNIQSLGATPILCGVVGNDAKGEVLKELLQAAELSDQAVAVEDGRPTTSKTRIISGSHHLLRVDEEQSSTINTDTEKALLAKVKHEIETGVHVIIFEDYDKGLLSENLIKHIVDLANAKGIITCVDPKKNNFRSYRNVTLFKPNFKEFVEGLKEEVNKEDFDKITLLARTFLSDYNINEMLITLSEKGMMLISRDDKLHTPAVVRNISDVSGAGDTVISTFALAMAAGVSKREQIEIANLAGGLVCEEVGVVPVNKTKLQQEYLRRKPV